MDIKWQRGKFVKFYAQMKIRVGGSVPMDIHKGDEFEYDGSILKYSGAEISSPQLRGAISNDWATLHEDEEPSVAPIRPNRNVAKSQSVNRDLGKVQRATGRDMETSTQDEDIVLSVSDRAAPGKGASPKILRAEDNRRTSRGMSINASDIETQEAVTIGRVRTSAKTVFNATNESETSRKITQLENMTPKAQLDPDFIRPGKNTVHREGVDIKMSVGKPDPYDVSNSQDDDGQYVGKVRKSASTRGGDGVSVADTSNIRGERAEAQEQLKPAKSAPELKIDVKINPKVRVALAIDPKFPKDWNFTGKLADRLEAVKKHGATPKFLEALYAAEGDQMRKVLAKTYPQQFSD